MTREDAIKIATESARKLKPSYYDNPFTPHDWVVEAIMRAYQEGYDVGYDNACAS